MMKQAEKTLLQHWIGVCMSLTLCIFTLPLVIAQTGQLQDAQVRDIPKGYTIIEGDIQVPIGYVKLLRQRSPGSPAATYQTNLWPGGIIPFEFSDDCTFDPDTSASPCVSQTNRTAMLSAMAVLESAANVDFRQCDNNSCDGNFVRIQNSNRNNSSVGMQGGCQIINIANWFPQNVIVHELLHCLGFFHEQSRPDRDNFVRVNCNNIQGGCDGDIFKVNFRIEDDASVYGPYDFGSVMHYNQCAFSMDCRPGATCNCANVTITVLPPNNTNWQTAIGQAAGPSNLDLLTLSFLYPQPNWCFLDRAYDGANGRPNGSFRRPFTDLKMAIANTPPGGRLWIQPGTYSGVESIDKRITLEAPLGSVTLN